MPTSQPELHCSASLLISAYLAHYRDTLESQSNKIRQSKGVLSLLESSLAHLEGRGKPKRVQFDIGEDAAEDNANQITGELYPRFREIIDAKVWLRVAFSVLEEDQRSCIAR